MQGRSRRHGRGAMQSRIRRNDTEATRRCPQRGRIEDRHRGREPLVATLAPRSTPCCSVITHQRMDDRYLRPRPWNPAEPRATSEPVVAEESQDAPLLVAFLLIVHQRSLIAAGSAGNTRHSESTTSRRRGRRPRRASYRRAARSAARRSCVTVAVLAQPRSGPAWIGFRTGPKFKQCSRESVRSLPARAGALGGKEDNGP